MRSVWRPLAISVVLSISGLAWVVWRVGSLSGLGRIKDLPVTTLAGIIPAMAMAFLFAGLRLQLLCRRAGLDLKLHHAVRAHILGMFGATVTPAGSGNLPFIALTLQHHDPTGGRPWAVSAAVFGADAMFHSWATPIAIGVLFLDHVYPRTPLLLGLAGAAFAIATVAAYVVQFRLAWLGPLARGVLRGPLRRWRERGLGAVDALLKAHRLLADAPLRFHLRVQLYSLLAASSFYAILYLLARGLSVDVGFLSVAASLTVIDIMAAFVPTPGGSGFFEIGVSYLLIARGGGAAVPVVVLVWRILTYYSIFVLGPMLGGYLVANRLTGPEGHRSGVGSRA